MLQSGLPRLFTHTISVKAPLICVQEGRSAMPLGGQKMLLSREWAESASCLTKCHITSAHHKTTHLLRQRARCLILELYTVTAYGRFPRTLATSP